MCERLPSPLVLVLCLSWHRHLLSYPLTSRFIRDNKHRSFFFSSVSSFTVIFSFLYHPQHVFTSLFTHTHYLNHYRLTWRDTWNSINLVHTCTNRYCQHEGNHLSHDRKGQHCKIWMTRPPREIQLEDTSCYVCSDQPPLIHIHTPRRITDGESMWFTLTSATPTLKRLLFPNFFDSEMGHEYTLRDPWPNSDFRYSNDGWFYWLYWVDHRRR